MVVLTAAAAATVVVVVDFAIHINEYALCHVFLVSIFFCCFKLLSDIFSDVSGWRKIDRTQSLMILV